MEQEIVEHSLRDVTTRLWEGSLGLPFQRVVGDAQPSVTTLRRGAEVRIDGAWAGRVYLQMTDALAERVARQMFSMTEEKPNEEQIEDCLKELTNITAGNLKTALPEPCTLSIPTPRTFAMGEIGSDEGRLLMTLSFLCGSEPFRLVLLKE